MAAASVSAQDAEVMIDGYFRIQTAAGKADNGNYVEVSGPFTAKPQLTLQEAERSAGSIFYIKAVKDDNGQDYRLVNLRSQGIDASKDAVSPDDYIDINDQSGNWGTTSTWQMAQIGFRYGYTSMARVVIGNLFYTVAEMLDSRADGYVPDHVKGDFINVTNQFNRDVLANLDLGIRLQPVEGEERTVQLYFDVPVMDSATDWVTDYDNPDGHAQVFEKAMNTMSGFMMDNSIVLEWFCDKDIELFNKWGYDIMGKYGDIYGQAEILGLTVNYIPAGFKRIFSDPDLLFNWIKLLAYYYANPGEDPFDEYRLGFIRALFGSVTESENELMSLMMQYFPRLNPGSRVFLIDGRVLNDSGDVTSTGTHWDAAGHTLGFASSHEVSIAGENGKWVLQPMGEDNGQRFYVTADRILDGINGDDANHDYSQGRYNACYFDFPVRTTADNIRFYTISDPKYKEVGKNILGNPILYRYFDLKPLDDVLEPLTPFLLECTGDDEMEIELAVDYDTQFRHFSEPAIEITDPSGAPRKPAARITDKRDVLDGVLLDTPYTTEGLKNYGGLVQDANRPVYAFFSDEVNAKNHIGFNDKAEMIPANQAVFVSSKNEPWAKGVFIGEPNDNNVTSAIAGVDADSAGEAQTIIYNLQGMRVTEPVAGQIYIINGRKVMLR